MKTKIDRKCRLQTINYLPPKNPIPPVHHQKVPQEQVLLFQSAATIAIGCYLCTTVWYQWTKDEPRAKITPWGIYWLDMKQL